MSNLELMGWSWTRDLNLHISELQMAFKIWNLMKSYLERVMNIKDPILNLKKHQHLKIKESRALGKGD